MDDHYYRPSTRSLWEGRQNGLKAEHFHEVIQFIDLTKGFPLLGPLSSWGLVGFACDEGVTRNKGRKGATEGPDAIRKSLANLPFSSSNTLYDFGDIYAQEGDLEGAQKLLSDVVANLLKNNIKPIVLGGGHEVTWGNFQGIMSAFPEQDCTIVAYDSHFDLRPLAADAKGTSGTSFLQIADWSKTVNKKFDCNYLGIQKTSNTANLFAKAKELNANILLADAFHEGGTEASVEMVEEIISRSDRIYVTICLDVFASPFAPGVSAPQPLGLFPWHLIPSLKRLARSGKVTSIDIAELNPNYDIDETTARLAASLISIFFSALGE